ncbi:hypothetical protein BJX64DRAFT_254590 [Aspergillus heterothallicus]
MKRGLGFLLIWQMTYPALGASRQGLSSTETENGHPAIWRTEPTFRFRPGKKKKSSSAMRGESAHFWPGPAVAFFSQLKVQCLLCLCRKVGSNRAAPSSAGEGSREVLLLVLVGLAMIIGSVRSYSWARS